jgi:3-deoxy-D-manno-octulosonate 8-phosphate phosphatase (KDO 8-P phosphatase)
MEELARRAHQTKVVLTDCDGVLTDAGVYYSARGEELKRFSVRDGMGVERLRNAGIGVAIVTGERSECVARRAEKLGIRAFLGVKDKGRELDGILAELGCAVASAAYIGDDVNDVAVLRRLGEVGLTGAPADAMPEVLELVHHRTIAKGGRGAFRGFAEWILDFLK